MMLRSSLGLATLTLSGAALADGPEEFRLPIVPAVIGLLAILAIGIFFSIRKRMQQSEDRRKEAVFEAHQARERAFEEFDAELKEVVVRANADDLSFVVLRRLLAHIKKNIECRGSAAIIKLADGEERLVSPDPRMQAEFEALVGEYDTALKSVARTGNPVVLDLKADVGRWTQQSLAALPIPVPDPGYGMLVISREYGRTFGEAELQDAADFAQKAVDSMELARSESLQRSDREIDSVSQVYNKPAIELRAQTAFTEAVRDRRNMSALYVEIDNYRNFLKDNGQEKLDIVIKTVAQRIERVLERDQSVGRIDACDFLVVMPNVPEFQGLKLAESLVKSGAREITIGTNQSASITLSVGVASKLPSDKHFMQVLERAVKGKDQARYQGGNTVRRASDEAGNGSPGGGGGPGLNYTKF